MINIINKNTLNDEYNEKQNISLKMFKIDENNLNLIFIDDNHFNIKLLDYKIEEIN